MKRNLLIALALFSLLSIVRAQSVLELPPKGKYKHNKKIESEYDKFRDETTVRLTYLSPLPSIGPVRLYIIPSFHYPGKIVKTPEFVVFWFQSSSSDWQFLHDRELLAIVDGERIDLGEALRVEGTVNSSRSGRYSSSVSVSEMLGLKIPLETFLRIIKAKVVEMRLGNVGFKLADDHLEALKDFASRMSPD
jgi:hypothetical protein